MWCVPELNDEYIERMEDVISLYEKDYNADEPVVCLDEKPIQLLEDLRKPKETSSATEISKKDHQYKRNGTANVFCGIEPLIGRYFNFVTKNKKAPEFAKVLNAIANKYPEASTIHLVMDNLSTHTEKSLVVKYGKDKAASLWNRFTIHYTPKNASWLDQAEIAIGLYSKQCLGKSRTPDIETLKRKTKAWNKAINRKKVKIEWGFTVEKAREKFKYN